MSTYPYVLAVSRLKELITKLHTHGVPAKATTQWLEALGYKSKNDRPMLQVLSFIGFTDHSKTPTDVWRSYRGHDYQHVLGNAVANGYRELFEFYPSANRCTPEELSSFFGTKTSAGQRSITAMSGTFLTLCELSDFGNVSVAGDVSQPHVQMVQAPGAPNPADQATSRRITGAGNGLTVNLNIQLALPESADEKMIKALFEAMRENLIDDQVDEN